MLLVQVITASQKAILAQLNWAVNSYLKTGMNGPGQGRIKML